MRTNQKKIAGLCFGNVLRVSCLYGYQTKQQGPLTAHRHAPHGVGVEQNYKPKLSKNN